MQELKDSIETELERTDGAMCAFHFNKKILGFKPPTDEEMGYKLVAAQILTLAHFYEKRPLVIMAEITEAIKEVNKNAST